QRGANKKKLFLGFFSLVAVLVLLSFFIAERYHDQALTVQLYSQKTLPAGPQETAPEVSSKQDAATLVAKPAAAPTMAAPPPVAVVIAVDRDVAPEQDKTGTAAGNRSEPEKQRALPPPRRKIHPLTAKNDSDLKQATTVSVSRQKITSKSGVVADRVTTAQKTGPAPNANHEPMAQMTAKGAGETNNGRARPAVSRGQADKIRVLNTALRINALLDQYTQLYNRKELGRFLALFTDDATENGSRVTSLVGDYKKLFAKTKRIDLRLEGLTWHNNQGKDPNGFLVQGNFVGIYTYKNGTTPRYTGKIAFRLRQDRENLKISSLVYSFQQQ
ncbi:MAG: hypothetical protein GWP11_06270, partial [Proteobacteria bacterium]|nr:hypothetical protein [Pseudomonadota bacterium]